MATKINNNWTTFYKIVTPQTAITKMTDSQEMSDVGAYNNYTWYQRLVQGSASRMTRYREYDLMDNDVEIARALDTIGEEMIGSTARSDEILYVDVLTSDEESISSISVLTIRAALRRWNQIHDWENRLFSICRISIKYGDCFFRKKSEFQKWTYVHPKNVIAAIVDKDDVTKIVAWQIKNDIKEAKGGGYGMPLGGKPTDNQFDTEIIKANNMVWFTLGDDMSDTQPFGESILRPVYRAQKQKELLEDAVIIYRIQRAPERRVFYIDVGKMPPQRVKSYLENIKNEIKQKKVPTMNGGQSEVDSVYNPQSMCLALDTEIPLLDGRTVTLQEMIDEHNTGKENWVYSIDPETGDIVPGVVSWAGITRKNTETIKLTLDNGDEIVCTPDHKFPVQGMGFVEAKDLTPNDSLWPFKTKEDTNSNRNIIKIDNAENQDTGTLTIDGDEIYHKHHTFALSSCFVRNSEDFFFACLSMKSMVYLLDGRTLSIDELRKEYESGKENWTYSIDQKTKKMIPGKISWAGYTRKNAEMVRVHLDNEEYVDCTPDHKFILRNGSEVEAQHLISGMSLMPIYKKKGKTNKKQHKELYERIVDNSTGKWNFTHLEVCPKQNSSNVIHHLDYNPSNNSPANLVELSHDDHWKYHHSPNGHTLGRMWRDNREQMIDSIRKYHTNRSEEQTATLVERNRKNGSNTWINHEDSVRANLQRGIQTHRDSFETYDGYCQHMSDMAKIQWTDEKKKIKPAQTKVFNKETKTYHVDDELFGLFVSEFNEGNNSMPKIKQALRNSGAFIEVFKRINSKNQNVINGKTLNFGDKCVYKLVKHGGYSNFQEFKENYAINHSVVMVEKLPHREDTGCLHVVDENENHNFALSSGVYVKNSRPDGRGTRVETLPGGQGLGELEDLYYFQKKVWRGLRVPTSYMIDPSEGGAVWNDGKVGTAYIQELRFTLFVQRLQAHIEGILDKEFKKFLNKSNIHVDENTYRIRLPEPTNFGKYRKLELDGQLLGMFGSADAIPYISKRFALKKYLQLSDEDIAENEFLLKEERGMDVDGDDEADITELYGTPGEEAMGGGAAGGAIGGGFGGVEMGMGADGGEMGAEGEVGAEAPPPTGGAESPAE